jgi:hypothetical protein
MYLEPNGGTSTNAFLPCPQCGPVKVSLERLRRWRLDPSQLWERIFDGMSIDRNVREIVPRRVWRIGKCALAKGQIWEVIVGRMLWRADGSELLRQASLPRRSIVFVPSRCNTVSGESPSVVSLCDVFSWSGTVCTLDMQRVEELLTTTGAKKSKPLRRSRKRSERAATIECLVRLMKDHVNAARDHACVTAEAGEVHLLPRPTQRDLARVAGVLEMTVSRCLRDPVARELRLLWELAGDLDGLLALPPPRH